MPKYVSGNGGYISISVDGISYQRIDVGTWTANFGRRLAENTHSGTEGNTNYHKVVRDNTWRLEMPFDSDSPAVDFITQVLNAEYLWIKFVYGESGVEDTLARTTLEGYEVTDNNASDIIRATMSGKGGRFL